MTNRGGAALFVRTSLFAILVGSLAASLSLAGCKGKGKKRPATAKDAGGESGETPHVTPPITWVIPAVQLELVATTGEERDLDASALAARLGAGLRASEYFIADERETPPDRLFAHARVVARLSTDLIKEGSTGEPAIIVALEVALIPRSSEYLPASDNVIVERVISPGESEAEIEAAFAARANGAVDEAVDGLIRKERLRSASREMLLAAMKGTTDVAVWALDLVADRRDRAVVSEVAALLRAREPDVVSAAITTLVALDETSAVPSLAKLADFQNYEQLRVLIEAIAALGGEDAGEFLEFVATGHPDDAIKAQARAAMGRLSP